jgi:hypothetical protein
VRLRAHVLALGAWGAAVGAGAGVRLRPVALVSPLMATVLRTRLWRREGMTAVCAVCGRRYRSPGPAPWCSVGCVGAAYSEPEPAPVPTRVLSPAERRASAEAAAVPQNGPLEWFHAPAEPAPVPEVRRGRAARTHRSAAGAAKET